MGRVKGSDVQHPFQLMGQLMAADAALLKEAREVFYEHSRDCMFTPTLVNYNKMVGKPEVKLMRDKIKQGIRKYLAEEPRSVKLVGSLPKAPYSRTLYGRIAQGTEIVDVGTGDGKRLVGFQNQLEIE